MSNEDPQIQEYRNAIAFGMDCKLWMESPLGKYLQNKANGDIEIALEALKVADAEDPRAIRKLQNDIAAAERFLLWMGEAVTEGENAERAYTASEAAD